ncbi:MAG TPA: hypothetical protein VIK04_20305, partial [Solirubrobacteraceae bacterium]
RFRTRKRARRVVGDGLDTLVMDADILESLLTDPDAKRKAKEVELKILRRVRKHGGEKNSSSSASGWSGSATATSRDSSTAWNTSRRSLTSPRTSSRLSARWSPRRTRTAGRPR